MSTHSKYQGLSNGEALERQKQYGKNIIEEKKKNIFFSTILNELKNPIVLLLVFAGLISYVIGESSESIAIFVVVLLNIGFTLFQVYKADNAVSALKSLIRDKCLVIRDSVKINIDTSELVPGDVVYLEAGARIPADIRILENTYTEVNESILTGEAALVQKTVSDDNTWLLFMGTVIVVGQVYGEVVHTGSNTTFGKIAETMRSVNETETNLQKKLKGLTKTLGIIGVIGAGIVFILAFVQDKGLFESFLLTISLAVAVVPEGLPAVMTAILSIGVGKMAKQGVVMRRLDAIEGLGDITVLATDKTGTLTQNKMKVDEVWFRENWKTQLSVDQIIMISFINNTSVSEIPRIDGTKEYVGDPTEVALREYIDAQSTEDQILKEYTFISEVPFSSDTRTRSVSFSINKDSFICINGAPESLLALSTIIDQQEKDQILKELQERASKGLRTIAFGVGTTESDFEFIGFVTLKDPLRPGIKNAIDEASSMGIRTILITGDNPLTAEAIAIEAGVTTKKGIYITGDSLEKMTDESLSEMLKTVSVFARISPIQKLRLVTVLQKMGEVVAMTGDGVNDAPALKQADIGVAMGKVGTDVAKEAADAVVTDDNYVTMIAGVKEGRAIVRRIELATMFFIAGNIGEFFYILLSLVLGLPLISPLQILFINLITDAVPAVALSFAIVKVTGIKEKNKSNSLLRSPEYTYIAIASSILAFSTVAVTWIYRDEFNVAKTVGFVTMMMLQQVMLLDVWLGLVKHTKDLKKLVNKSIIGAIGTTIVTIYLVFNSPLFIKLFDLTKIPLSAYVYFLYAVILYIAFVLTRIHTIQMPKK